MRNRELTFTPVALPMAEVTVEIEPEGDDCRIVKFWPDTLASDPPGDEIQDAIREEALAIYDQTSNA